MHRRVHILYFLSVHVHKTEADARGPNWSMLRGYINHALSPEAYGRRT